MRLLHGKGTYSVPITQQSIALPAPNVTPTSNAEQPHSAPDTRVPPSALGPPASWARARQGTRARDQPSITTAPLAQKAWTTSHPLTIPPFSRGSAADRGDAAPWAQSRAGRETRLRRPGQDAAASASSHARIATAFLTPRPSLLSGLLWALRNDALRERASRSRAAKRNQVHTRFSDQGRASKRCERERQRASTTCGGKEGRG